MSETKPSTAPSGWFGLNQPWRALIALAEAVVAAVAVLVAVALWHRGVVSIISPVGGGRPPLVSTVFYGNWMSGAIGLGTLSAVLVVDALRQLVLAIRTRRTAPARHRSDEDSPTQPAAT